MATPRARRGPLVLAALLAAGCTAQGNHVDASYFDFGIVIPRDASDVEDVPPPLDPCAPSPCGAVELCGPATADGGVGEGNGLDDNCNGQVDETCLCTLDEVHACFPGSPDRRDVGPCHAGVARCNELGLWGACDGAVVPSAEVCDGVDNDCNGRVDDGLAGCASTLRCPVNASTRPLSNYVLDARTIDATATSFAWSLVCPAGVSPCPAIAAPDDPTLNVQLVQAGSYTVELTLGHASGPTETCRWIVYVQGTGLRVELDWDTRGGLGGTAGADVDLHVAPIDPRRATTAGWFSPDDCYYATCRAPGGVVDWNVGATDTRFAPDPDASACQDAPAPDGPAWRASGHCWNPRLDTDDIACDPAVVDPTDPDYCFVENVNVSSPPHDVVFRLAVNFYRDHGTCTDASTADDVTHPRLQVFCGGVLRGELGGVDEGLVALRCADSPGYGSDNWTWLAADVRFETNACGVEDCAMRPLHASAGAFPACAMVSATDDVCEDDGGRVFVRHAGARPVDAELPSAL